MLITTDEIFEEFEELDPRDQSQYLLELGYDLPRFDDSDKRDEDLVSGCQSQVWLRATAADETDPELSIVADSDAEIVRGLITILMASYSGKRSSEILAFPITDVFDRLNLRRYISPQRQNGLQGMVDRIRELAAKHVQTPPHVETSAAPNPDPKRAVAKVERKPFDAEVVKQEFPALTQTLDDGLRPVYLDSGASAQKPRLVIEKEREVEEQYFANAYRGRYRFGARIDEELEASRQKIANFIGASSPTQIAFTSGTTAALNIVAFGWGRKHVQAGDEIVITPMEHHANYVPWQQVAKETGATLKFLPLTSDGRLDESQFESVITDKTKIVAVTAMSNVLGTVTPLHKLAAQVHKSGGIIVVDAAQSVPHMKTDVVADDLDFLVFSGHKLYGPTGVGVMYGKPDRLAETDPILFGGHMISQVSEGESTWAAAPAKFEAGTLPIVQAIALGAAVDWVEQFGVEAIHAHEQSLLASATARLQKIPGLKIYGPALEHKGAIISFRIDGIHPEDLAVFLDERAVLTRHGHHCTMPLHTLLNVSATTRVSFAAYNTEADIDELIAAIENARDRLERR